MSKNVFGEEQRLDLDRVDRDATWLGGRSALPGQSGSVGITNLNEGADITITGGGPSRTVGRAGDSILLFDSGGAVLREYAFTDAGLTAGLAAMGAGDVLELPAGTIAGGPWTVATGTLRGIAQDNSILTGQVTVSGGALETLYVDGTSSPQVTMTSGFIRRCKIETTGTPALTQTGGQIYDSQLLTDLGDLTWDISGAASGWFVRAGYGGAKIEIDAIQGMFYCTSSADNGGQAYELITGSAFFCQARSSSNRIGFL